MCWLQLGSLVIVLPSIHTGGALTVEHNGVVHKFDNSLESVPAEPLLQWGAFYSDCKHEVHEVTSGARITLTYNLISELPSNLPLKVRHLLLTTWCPSLCENLLSCTPHRRQHCSLSRISFMTACLLFLQALWASNGCRAR